MRQPDVKLREQVTFYENCMQIGQTWEGSSKYPSKAYFRRRFISDAVDREAKNKNLTQPTIQRRKRQKCINFAHPIPNAAVSFVELKERWRKTRKLHANMLRLHNKGQPKISWFPPLTKNHKMCEDDGIEIKSAIEEETTRFWPRFLFYTFWSRLPLRFLVLLWHFFISSLVFFFTRRVCRPIGPNIKFIARFFFNL